MLFRKRAFAAVMLVLGGCRRRRHRERSAVTALEPSNHGDDRHEHLARLGRVEEQLGKLVVLRVT